MGRLIPAGTGLDYYRNVFLMNEQEPEPLLDEEVGMLEEGGDASDADAGAEFLTT